MGNKSSYRDKFQGSRFRSIRHGQIHPTTYNLRITEGLFRATFDGWKKYPRTPEVNASTPSIEEMTAQLGVDNCLDQSVSTLSHGQRQRIAIIRALRKPFRLLLLDEPFSHLDEENQKHASRLIQDVTEANDAGLILSSLGSSPALSFDQQISL